MHLYESIAKLESVDECYRFFQDLCSITELRALEQRFEVACLLNEGNVYTEILQKTGASSATISRVNRTLQYGSDGFKDFFEKEQARQSCANNEENA
jgi:TrpR-related protein YerC/YecD